MKKIIGLVILFIACALLIVVFANRAHINTVTGIAIANEQYTDRAAIENTEIPKELSKDKDVYASIYFIESPKGMKYRVKWFIDGKEVKTEEKEMTTNTKGFIIYKLEKEKLHEGLLKLQVLYEETVLAERETMIR
ncbi:MAG: hypothetical protein ACOX4M_10860 [Acetivibrionales bacterium]